MSLIVRDRPDHKDRPDYKQTIVRGHGGGETQERRNTVTEVELSREWRCRR